jgi:hypothetical protein
MASPFRFKYPLASQTQPTTPSQLSARNFLLSRITTPVSSVPSASQHLATVADDIDDPPSDNEDLPRKRTRYSPVDDNVDFDDDTTFALPSTADTARIKRPPVILPQAPPDSPPIDFSPSRRQSFLPNGLAASTAKLIHEHHAFSSVSVPRLDRDDIITITAVRTAEGGTGYICSIDSQTTVFLLTPKGFSLTNPVRVGDCISLSNAVKLDTLWICTSWHHNLV